MAHNTTTKTSTRSDGPCFMDPLLQRVPTQSHLQPAHAAPLPGKVRTPGPTNQFCSPVLKINARALPPARLPQTSPVASSASPPAEPALRRWLECCPPRLQRAPAAAAAGTRRLPARAPPARTRAASGRSRDARRLRAAAVVAVTRARLARPRAPATAAFLFPQLPNLGCHCFLPPVVA